MLLGKLTDGASRRVGGVGGVKLSERTPFALLLCYFGTKAKDESEHIRDAWTGHSQSDAERLARRTSLEDVVERVARVSVSCWSCGRICVSRQR